MVNKGMIIKTETRTVVTRGRILKFQCEKCKQVFERDDDGHTPKEWETSEALEITIRGGFGSRYVGDQNVATTVLCQDCMWELIGPYLRIEGHRYGEDWREWTAEEVKEMQEYHKTQHEAYLKSHQ